MFTVLALMATSLVAFQIVSPAVANAAPGQGSAFDCYGGTIYNVQRGANAAANGIVNAIDTNTISGATATTTAITTIPAGGATNAFGITRGGTSAYVIDQVAGTGVTSVLVHAYETGTQAWTTYNGTAQAGNSFVAGAVDPSSGVYYYANYNASNAVATIYGFKTSAYPVVAERNTAISGVVATATLPLPTSTTLGANGDFAFDQGGNLYLVESAGTTAAVAIVKGPLPTTGSSTGAALTSTTLQTFTLSGTLNYNGIAFDNLGRLYTQYANTTSNVTTVVQLNPNTGAIIAGPTTEGISGTVGVDLAACSLNPTLSLATNIVSRANATDEFGLSITGGGITANNTATTTGSSPGLQTETAGPVIGFTGTGYTVAETAASGSLANYNTTYSCTDAAASNRVVASGTGQSFTLPFPSPATGSTGAFVTCVFTNTAKPVLTVNSVFSASRVNAGDQFTAQIRTGSATGTVVNSTTSATTAGSGSAVTAGTGTTGAYQAVAGTTYYITEAAAGTTNTVQYARFITCTDSNGLQTGLPNNQPFTGSLTLTVVDGSKIGCTISNGPAGATLTVNAALGSGRAVAGDQFTTSIHTGSADGPTVSSTTNATTTGTGSTVTAGTGTTGVFAATPGTGYYTNEDITGTGAALYNRTITCTDANGVSTDLPTNLPYQRGTVGVLVPGAAVTCVITNSATGVSLSLTKTNPTQLLVGTAANYSLAVTNNGGVAATTARVVDQLPANVAYNSAAGTGWTCAATGTVTAGQLVTCNYTGSIAPLATSTLTVNVTPQAAAAGTTLQNKAAVDPTGGTSPVTASSCTANGTPAGCAVPAAQSIALVTAGADSATTAPVTPVTLNVLSNDTATGGGTSLNPASVTVTTAPGHGSTTVNTTTGAITYTPANNFSGVDTYVYRVCDTSSPTPICASATDTVTVPSTVNAVNDTGSTAQNTAISTAVLANDTRTAGGAPLNPASVTVTAGPSHGTTSVNTTTGAITYTPANGYTGTDVYSYRVCDTSSPTPNCATATVTITVGGNTVTAVNDTGTTPPVTPIATDVRSNDSSSTGQPLGIPTVTVAPGHGVTSVNGTTSVITYTPASGFSGVDVYSYRVCDTSNPTPVCATATVTITVPNTVTAVNDTATTPQNTAVSTTVLTNDTITTGGSPLNPASVTVTSAPAHGSTTVNTSTGAIRYTPANGYSGSDGYSYRVCDSSSPTPVCAVANVAVTVGGNVVVANDDTSTTAPGVPVSTNVKANDSSSTGQPLGIPTVTTAPTHGTTAVDGTTGNITYTPAVGFSGTDSYIYTLCDTSNPTPNCDPATVTISVPNTVTAEDDSVATAENTPVVSQVLNNDSVSSNGSPLNPASITITSGPSNGTVTVNTTTGAVTYTPNIGYAGPDSFTYRVCDSSTPTPVCDTAVVSVAVGSGTVIATPDTDTTLPGTPVTDDVRSNDSSSTGEPLQNPTVSTAPNHGSTSVDPTTGQITYTPVNGFSGTDVFSYTVCDDTTPTPVCDTTTVTITVANQVVANDDMLSTPQNTPGTTPILNNDTVLANGSPLNPASVLITTAVTHGVLSVDAGTGAVTYTPNNGYTGSDYYTYSVCDGSTPTPVCDDATVNITVGANTVTAVPDFDTTAPATAKNTDVRFNDSTSTGQPLVNPTVVNPAGHGTATVNGDGTIRYTPTAGFSGTDTYRYRVCDTSNPTPVCSVTTVTITVPNTVTAVNDASPTTQNTPVTTPVLTNDTVTPNAAPLNPASVTVSTAPLHGTTSVNPTTGAVTYTPNAGYTGTDTYGYTVCDRSTPTPVCASATVTITVGSNVVIANDDNYSTPPATAEALDVLSNDTGAAGGAPLNPASVTILSPTSHGTLSVNPTSGVVTYTPATGFSGVDSFTYRVCDSSNPTPVCDDATVTIAVPNEVHAVNDSYVTPQNVPTTNNVLVNDSVSAGGSPLDVTSVVITVPALHGAATVNPTTGAITYTPTTGYTGTDSYTYQVCDNSTPTRVCATAVDDILIPVNQVTAVDDAYSTPPGTPSVENVRSNDISNTGEPLGNPAVINDPSHGSTSVNATTGEITYVPDADFSGVDTYTYQVCDSSVPTPVCDQATVTVTVPNTVTAVDDSATTPQNTAVLIPLLDNDSATPGGAPLNPGSVTVLDVPANGTAQIDPSTGNAIYTPGTNFEGTDTFTYQVCDLSTPTPVCAIATVTVTVPHNLPDAVDDSSTTDEGTPVVTDVLANDTVTFGGAPLNPASVTVTGSPLHGSTSVDPTDGRITYTPEPGYNGTDAYTYQVCDASVPTPDCDSAVVTLTVVGAPLAPADDVTSTLPITPVDVDVLANDTVPANSAPLDPGSVTVTAGPSHGTTSVDPSTGVITYTPAAEFSGTDVYTYRVCDTSIPTPDCAGATVTIEVPSGLAANADSYTTPQNTPITSTVLENDSVSPGGAPINPSTISITTAALHGTATADPATGTTTYTPDANYTGTDTFRYTVCDTSTPLVNCQRAFVTIVIPANAVDAVDDSGTTPPITPITTDVLGNDTVPTGGSPLDPASVTVTLAPGHGETSVNLATGAITYLPADGFSGVDTYTYQVCDSSIPTPACDTAVVTITVPNTVIATDDADTIPQNATVTGSLLNNDGTTPTGGSPLDPTSVTILTPPSHGTVTVNPVNGDVTYSAAAGYAGVDTFVYQVCDSSTPERVCDSATVTLTITGNTVTAVDDNSTTTPTAPVTTDVLGNDTITPGGSPLNPATVIVSVNPAHGDTSVNPTTGAITYTPAAGFSGVDTYTYQVCDSSTPTPSCDSAVVTITVTDEVTAVGDAATTGQNTPTSVAVLENDTVSPGGAPLNPASVTVRSSPTHGTVTIDPTTGAITYTPAAGYSGTDTFAYTVCDTSTPTPVCSAPATVTITIPANTVTAVADPSTTPQNTPVVIPVLANDTVTPGGSPLNPASVTVISGPSNGTVTVDPTTGAVTYTPATGFSGSDSFAYSVCDSSTPIPVCAEALVGVDVGSNTVVAADDSDTTAPATPVTTDVRDNDTSSTGQALATPTVTSGPPHGTTSVDPTTGEITYTPTSGFSGIESYTYRVCDTSTPEPICDDAAVTITVPNTVTAVADPVTTAQNTPVVVDVLANDTITPGGAPLNPASVAVVSGPTHGTLTVNPATGAINYTPAAGYSGPDTFSYTVCDTSSPTPVCGEASVTISVGSNTVEAVNDTASTSPVTPVAIDVLANDTVSPGGAALNPASITATTPGHGTVSVDPSTGVITYTPADGFSGIDSVTYTVCDSSTPAPVCSTATVTVTVPNEVSAAADPATTAQNTAVVVDVLANDSVTPGGAPLNPASVSVTPPAHGSVTIDPLTGTITYTPAAGYSGTDTLTYTVCDTSTPTPVCATALITVTVGSNTVAAVNDSGSTPPITPISTNVLANDTVAAGGAPLNPASVTVVSDPAHGTTSVNPATGAITYTPELGFSGIDSYGYAVCDTSTPSPLCAEATVTITVPTVVTAVPDEVATPQNTAVTTPVLENDTTTYNAAPLNPASVTVLTGPSHGTVTVDPTTGEITYTPTTNYSGPDGYTYQVCDFSSPEPVCDSTTVTISVGGNTVAATDDSATTSPGSPVDIDVLANDTSATGLPLGLPEITGGPAHGTVTVNDLTGVVTYTPAAGFSGTDSFTYTVCDSSTPSPVCDSATVAIEVPSSLALAPDSGSTPQNTAITTDVLANDTVATGGAPLDPTSVTVSVAPAHGTTTVDATTGAVTYTPNANYTGPDTYDYTVCDTSLPTPVCATSTVTLTIGSNVVTAVDDTGYTLPSTPLTIDVLANDTVATAAALDAASVSVVTGPTNGSTTVDPATGAITYTPNDGFSGDDTFTYTVCDSSVPVPVCATATVTVTVPKAGLGLVKDAAVNDVNGDGVTSVGDTITYTFTVTNIGDIPVTGIAVVDPKAGQINCPTTELAAGEVTVCTAASDYEITDDDVTNGVTNSAYVVGDTNCPDGTTGCAANVEVKSEVSTVVTPVPVEGSLAVIKTGSWNDADSDGRASVGDTVSWSITVTNPGAVTVTALTVDDPTAGAASCPTSTLLPGTSVQCLVDDHVLTDADVTRGSLSNTAAAAGVGPAGAIVSPAVTAVVTLPISKPLSYTGFATWQFLWIGIIALLLGSAMVVAGRRRRTEGGTPTA